MRTSVSRRSTPGSVPIGSGTYRLMNVSSTCTRFPGRTNWTRMHWRWLGKQAFASPHQQFVFGECIRRIEETQARCDRLDKALQAAMGNWSLAPLVKALHAARGWPCRRRYSGNRNRRPRSFPNAKASHGLAGACTLCLLTHMTVMKAYDFGLLFCGCRPECKSFVTVMCCDRVRSSVRP